MRYRATVIALAALLLFGSAARAEEPDFEPIVQAYFQTIQIEGMTRVGRFMHPEALERFKAMLLPVYELEAEMGQAEFLGMTFGAEATIDDVRAADPELFMNGFMGILAAQMAETPITFDKIDVVGSVPEGEDRHVLVRMTVGSEELEALSMTQFEVLSFRPYEDSWRLLLNGEMVGMAKAIRDAMAREAQ